MMADVTNSVTSEETASPSEVSATETTVVTSSPVKTSEEKESKPSYHTQYKFVRKPPGGESSITFG